ncbi:MAG: ABC transporter permease, partial [Proteobacteria bacterium]|nr:ABC transporter permease [Pseudomonadota bacterium]
MLKYAIRKLLLTIPLIIGVVTLIFFLIELSPGNIADKFFTPDTTPEVRELIIAKYGLDQPAITRYFLMLRNLAVFDFGVSMAQERPAFDVILDALPNTLILSAITLLVIFPTG